MSPIQKLVRILLIYGIFQLLICAAYLILAKYGVGLDVGYTTFGYLIITIIALVNMMGRIQNIPGLEVNILQSFARAMINVVPPPIVCGILIDYLFTEYKPDGILRENTIRIIQLNTGMAIIVALFYTKAKKHEPLKTSKDSDTLDSFLD